MTAAVNEFLYFWRSFYGHKRFWIDSVCISQQDLEEKATQIPLMAEIYQRAARVIVWLGPPPKEMGKTFAFRRIMRVMGIALLFGSAIKREDLLKTIIADEETAFKLLGAFFSHQWFERIWVVQEIAYGNPVHIMYNGTSIDWPSLSVIMTHLEAEPELKRRLYYFMSPQVGVDGHQASAVGLPVEGHSVLGLHWRNAIFMDGIRRSVRDEVPQELVGLLLSTLQFRATQPRDKIFAVLGIAADSDALQLIPTYEGTDEDIFLQTATYLLSNSEKWYAILAITGKGIDRMTHSQELVEPMRLPSWVLDFRFHTGIGARIPQPKNAMLSDQAGKATASEHDPNILQVQAVHFDSIQDLGPGLEVSPNLALQAKEKVLNGKQLKQLLLNGNQDARRWYLSCRELARRHLGAAGINQESADQEFWELCMNYTNDDTETARKPPHSQMSLSARRVFEFFMLADVDELLHHNAPIEGLAAQEAIEQHSYLIEAFAKGVFGKAFCLTTNGCIAMVPRLSQVGDTFVHVRGGFVPGLFREQGARAAEWVGACYVHGVEDIYTGTDWHDWFIV